MRNARPRLDGIAQMKALAAAVLLDVLERRPRAVAADIGSEVATITTLAAGTFRGRVGHAVRIAIDTFGRGGGEEEE